MYYIGVDLGGTNIAVGITDETGKLLHKDSIPTGADRGPDEVVKDMAGLVKKVVADFGTSFDEVGYIGIGTPGTADRDNGVVIFANNLKFYDYPLAAKLKEFSGFTKDVLIENDANAAAKGEAASGAAKGYANSVMITLGTGVGGGIIIDGKLYKGKSGAAGEMHFKMRTDKHRKCTCGSWDCFEAYASGTGLKLTAEEISGDKEITTYDVIENLDRPIMKKIFNVWQNDILEGIIGLANLFDPDCVVLSGSMAEFVDIEYLEREANSQIVTQPFKVVKASAGNYSGMIGAGLLALGVR